MTTVDTWLAPGSGTGIIAPNSCWVDVGGTTGANWQAQFQFFNASNVLVTVNVTIGLAFCDTGAIFASLTFTGVNTCSFSFNLNTANRTYGCFVTYNGGTSCDHCVCTTTSNPGAGSSNHPLFKVRRTGAWVAVSGHELRLRRGGVWKPLSNVATCSNNTHTGGVYVRRTGAWTTRTSPW